MVGKMEPVVDIKETENEYLARAELPGIRREDVKVSLEDDVLTIEGERFYGTFCRSFTLPEFTDANAIRAESKDGVLNVHVPKLKVEKRQALQIKVE